MTRWLECPYLGGPVELTDERESHVREKHGDVISQGFDRIRGVLAAPELVRRDPRSLNTLKFSRWYDDDGHGRHAVVVVVTDQGPPPRSWIVTAFPARRIPESDVIWRRS